MRSMHPDAEYFAFLDEMREKGEVSTVMAPIWLINLIGTANQQNLVPPIN